MKIVLAQINTIVGDFEGNLERILRVAAEARDADLIAYPELAIAGYPPKDLLNRKDFIAKSEAALQALAGRVTKPALLAGWIEPHRSPEGKDAFNAAALLANSPLAAPGMFTSAILVFIFAWNDFLFATSLTSTDRARTVPAAITFFTGSSQFTFPTGQIAAASVVVTVPIIVMVLIFQRRIVSGLTSGAVKG